MGAARSNVVPAAETADDVKRDAEKVGNEFLEEDWNFKDSNENGCSEGSTEDEWCFIEDSLPDESDQDGSEGSGSRGPLDEKAFASFAPLLAASQEYAGNTGCRFRSDSFSCLSRQKQKEVKGASNELSEWAEAVVREFADRLIAREPALLEEMDRAFEIVMDESVRNAMIAAFREVELWPPVPRPDSICDDDCDYEDLQAPVPVIAQRAWNDEAKRRRAAHGADEQFRRAVTASYLVDFAHEVGWQLPAAAQSHMEKLSEFGARMAEWSQAQTKVEQEAAQNYREDPEARDLSESVAASSCQHRTEQESSLGRVDDPQAEASCWSDSLRGVALSLASAVFIGAAATAGVTMVHHAMLDAAAVPGDAGKCKDESPRAIADGQ
eukprot:gb/GFBE01025151.1/.p1 GENE.gb/GFBE01025151.1/~~gb/GFBE01025151.1/.p1  ORF type:complete len:382 (+),score=96.81 gb/GFBE01025151.1/:1-1146(+)